MHYNFNNINRRSISYLSAFFFSIIFLFSFSPVEAVKIVKTGIPTNFFANTVPDATYEWIFPDGSTQDGKVVSYTFYEPGETSVTLKIIKYGNSNTMTKKVFVQNNNRPTAIPIVTIDGESFYSGTIPLKRNQKISFTSESIDRYGKKEDIIETWWVKGRAYDARTLSHLFQSSGLYPIKLVVAKKNNTNLRDEFFFQIEVINTPPTIETISFEKDKKLNNKKVTISANASDADGKIKNYRFEILEYNTVKLAQISESNFAIFNLEQFPGDHEYFFRVTATDNDNKSVKKTSENFIPVSSNTTNHAPDVKMMLSPGNSGTTKTTFFFSVSATDEDREALRYEWILSDGTKFRESSFSHEFKTPGIKTAILRVSDGLEVVEASVDIVVVEDEVLTNQPPTVNIKGVLPSTAGDTRTIFQFFSEIDDPDNDEIKLVWDLGDGKTMNRENIGYRFQKPGKYTIKLTGSDGSLQQSDELTITVVEEGLDIPENKSFNNVDDIDIPVSTNIPLAVKIDSPKSINRNYSPFSATLKKILISEKKTAEKQLSSTTNSADKEILQTNITTILKKIDQLEENPFFLRGEFDQGRIINLKDDRDILVQKYKQETRDATRREQIQKEILDLSKAIRRRELGISKNILVEDILIFAKKQRTTKLSTDISNKLKNNIKKEIDIIDTELKKLKNNPFLARTQEVKVLLLELKVEKEKSLTNTTSEPKKRSLKQQIEQIDNQIALIDLKPDKDGASFLFANLTGTTNTKFFFYGQAPKKLKQALFFEWELGTNIHVPGQNVSIRYKKPGLYRVRLTVSDSTNTVADTITIKIVENTKKE